MKLNAFFPNNFHNEQLIRQERIPCLCKVSKDFEIYFPDSIRDVSGFVYDWDRNELELRAIAGGGGEYTHYANGLITLKKISLNVYEIIYLEMFYVSFGWCIVLKDGEYAPPGNFWDEE